MSQATPAAEFSHDPADLAQEWGGDADLSPDPADLSQWWGEGDCDCGRATGKPVVEASHPSTPRAEIIMLEPLDSDTEDYVPV
ncbi:MAG: hypothetical protein ABR564_04620 [Candidatus Dormibacteria bacterium]